VQAEIERPRRKESEEVRCRTFRRLSRRGVELIIASLLLIMITVAACVSFYVYSTKLLGSLEAVNPPATMDNVKIEAYNWNNLTSLILNVRNVGTNVLNFGSAHWFVGGVQMSATVTNPAGGTCTTITAIAPGTVCVAKLTISGLAANPGIVYVAKMVLSDGTAFSTLAIAGQVTGQTGVP